MLRNLLKTWQTLAPEEVRYDEHGLLWLKDPYTASLTIEPSSDGFLWPYEKSILQGSLQKCIEDRSWAWRIETGFIQNNRTWTAGVTPGGVFGNDREVVAKYEKPACLALLTAYLTALAAQRSPNRGAWQHSNGSTVFVKTTAKWSGDKHNADSFAETYQVEESPEIKLQPRLLPGAFLIGAKDLWVYDGPKDYGDRVFYSDSSGRWARETSVFLSLVGSNQEHEGKLRFTEVSNAKA